MTISLDSRCSVTPQGWGVGGKVSATVKEAVADAEILKNEVAEESQKNEAPNRYKNTRLGRTPHHDGPSL